MDGGAKNNSQGLQDDKSDLISLLISQGKLSKKEGEEIKKESKKKNLSYFALLKKDKIIDEKDLIKSCAVLFGLSQIRLEKKAIPDKVLKLIPEDKARQFNVIPFERKDEVLKIAIIDPYQLPKVDSRLLSSIRKKHSDVKIWFYLTTENDLKQALSKYNQNKKRKEKKQIAVEDKKEEPTVESEVGNPVLKILIKQGAVKPDKAERIMKLAKEEKKDITEVLIEQKVKQEKVYKALAQSVDLRFMKIDPERIKPEAVERIPVEIGKKYQIGAYNQIGDRVLMVGTTDPNNLAVKEIIQFSQERKGIDIKLSVISKADLEKIWENYSIEAKSDQEDDASKTADAELDSTKIKTIDQLPKEKIQVYDDGTEEDTKKLSEKTSKDDKPLTAVEKRELKGRIGSLLKHRITTIKELKGIINKGSIPRIVAAIVSFALDKRASDIHIQPSEKGSRLRYRIDGVLSDIAEITVKLHPAIISRIKILSKLRIDEKRVPQDGRFEVDFENREVDLRVSTLPTSCGEKVVMRILDKSKKEFKLDDLGLTGKSFEVLKECIKEPYGMIIATGPTGSGKSTTLYASLSTINRPEVNIVTLEDPVEYDLFGVSQSQARPDIGFSFANGLRSVLRQDPDIIMVGEIRDKETAEMSIHAALTGHLVFSTLHTNDASGAIPRLIDMGIEPFLISSSANAFLAQRLVRRICPDCKEKDPKFNQESKEKIKKILSNLPEEEKSLVPPEEDWQLYRGKGCSKCHQGYRERVGIFEILKVNNEIKRSISQSVSASDIRKKAIDQGMITMQQDGVIKALNGITTLAEVFRVTTEKEEQF